MDPNTCYQLWLQTKDDNNLFEDACEHWCDLMEWLSKGGFEPNWTPSERYEFIHWADEGGSMGDDFFGDGE